MANMTLRAALRGGVAILMAVAVLLLLLDVGLDFYEETVTVATVCDLLLVIIALQMDAGWRRP